VEITTEHDLVAGAKQGSSTAFAAIFDRYWLAVWRTAYAVTQRRDLADDVAQDTFVRAASSLSQFTDGRPLGPWLTRIAVNRGIDLIRAERRSSPLSLVPEPQTEDIPRDTDLYTAIAALDLDRRLVVVLHFILGVQLNEAAEILNLPPGTVASRLSRALDDLRRMLEADQ